MKTKTFIGTSDEQLVQEHLNGSSKALGLLYNKYYPKVYQKCLSFTKNPDDAFDLTQDTLMKAFGKVSSFKGNSKFSTWLYAIAQNSCITFVTKARNYHFEDISQEQAIKDDAPNSDELDLRIARENKECALMHALDSVPSLDKELLDLKYTHGFSIKDLQGKFSLSASAVKMRLMRARKKLEQSYYLTAI